MDQTIIGIIMGAVGIGVGAVAGKFLFSKDTKKQVQDAEAHAQSLIKEAELRAENVKKEKILEAKEKFVQLKADHEKEVIERSRKVTEGESKLKDAENRIKQKETSLSQKEGNLDKQLKENDSIKENLNKQIEIVNQKRAELEKHQEEHLRKLEKIANLSAEEAKAQLIEGLKQEANLRRLHCNRKLLKKLN